jgi:hypothetical protein
MGGKYRCDYKNVVIIKGFFININKNSYVVKIFYSFFNKIIEMEDRGQSKREYKLLRSPRPQKKAKSNEKSRGREAVEAAVSFSKFIPLISEIENVFNEILDLVEAAEHNKRTCGIARDRVNVAELAVRDLRVRNKDKKDFFNSKNYKYLQNLVIIIARIKKFISDISQMKPLIKHIRAKNIEKTFKELCEEFDGYFNALCFSINLTTADELEQLKADQDDLADVRLKIEVYYTFI